MNALANPSISPNGMTNAAAIVGQHTRLLPSPSSKVVYCCFPSLAIITLCTEMPNIWVTQCYWQKLLHN